jgi:hypothetical protein
MTAATRNVTPAPPLNLGIYGCTHAGKTRFLYQLLSGWHQDHRLLNCSPTCQAFLTTVEADVNAYGHSKPTVAATEGMTVEVRRDGKGAPWRLTLRDLRGELLTEELDNLTTVARQGAIPAQVRRCDAFLFFFDPTSAEDKAHLDEHHRRELKRAELFIDYVLQIRENRHLPILFVATRLDLWEDDPAVRVKAKEWFARVNQALRQRYQVRLGKYYPPSLVREETTTLAISSVRGRQVEQVIERVAGLVEDAGKFARESRGRAKLAVWAGLALAGVFLVWLLATLLGGPGAGASPGANGKTDRLSVYAWTPDEVRKKLDELDRLVNAHPRGPQPATAEEAKQLNAHLRWMAIKLESLADESAAASFPPAVRERLEDAWRKTAGLVRAKTEEVNPLLLPEQLAVLAAYLDGVSAPATLTEDLAAAQKNYWKEHRRYVVRHLADLLKRHDETASEPAAALQDVIKELRNLEQDAKRCTVRAPEAQQALLNELQAAATFCENREKARSYPARFRVVAATLSSAFGFSPNRRRLTLQSPRQEPLHLDLQVHVKSAKDADLEAPPRAFDVKLALGDPGTIILAIHADQRDEWDTLHVFDLRPARAEDALAVLGMPLLRRGQAAVTKALSAGGYQLRVEFSEFPAVPPLLWDALDTARGRKKG